MRANVSPSLCSDLCASSFIPIMPFPGQFWHLRASKDSGVTDDAENLRSVAPPPCHDIFRTWHTSANMVQSCFCLCSLDKLYVEE